MEAQSIRRMTLFVLDLGLPMVSVHSVVQSWWEAGGRLAGGWGLDFVGQGKMDVYCPLTHHVLG